MEIHKTNQYLQAKLDREMLEENPFVQFKNWYRQAEENNVPTPNALSLATASATGAPSVRTVLLKYYDEKGFVFYTNYNSRKAKEIAENSKVAMLFPWLQLERQIRINGRIEKISMAQSFKYFSSRPKESQIAAWCSNQSEKAESHEFLLMKFEEMKNKFRSGKIPLPSAWGGYRLIPNTFEFWQGRNNRLHDRFQYTKKEDGWTIDRLAP
jgi:pyridoxamine 5'-phosphate oxidase